MRDDHRVCIHLQGVLLSVKKSWGCPRLDADPMKMKCTRRNGNEVYQLQGREEARQVASPPDLGAIQTSAQTSLIFF